MWLSTFKCSTRYRQYFCSFCGFFLMGAIITNVSWLSPTLPFLTSSNSPIGVQLTKEEASWVASAQMLSILPGSVLAALVVDKIGRKQSLFLAPVLLFIPWIGIIFSTSYVTLIVPCMIMGLGTSIVVAVTPIYIAEISEKDIRGRLIFLSYLGQAIATMITLGLGPFLSFTMLGLTCSTFPAAAFVLCCFIPESPYYLIKIDQRETAYQVLNGLSSSADTDMWLKEIETTVQKDVACKITLKTIFLNYKKSFGIILALKTIQQFSGTFAITAYLQTIMKESQTSLSPEISSVIFAAIQIPSVLISAILVDKVGRRPLLMTSATGCAIALIGEGIYFYLLEQKTTDLSSVYFLPTLLLVLYYLVLPVGVSNLVFVVAGELFTTNVKKVGGGAVAFYAGLLSFVSIKTFNPISEALGMYTVFWIFGGVCVLGVLFAYFLLPETKDKSFDEIQNILKGNHKDKTYPPPPNITQLKNINCNNL